MLTRIPWRESAVTCDGLNRPKEKKYAHAWPRLQLVLCNMHMREQAGIRPGQCGGSFMDRADPCIVVQTIGWNTTSSDWVCKSHLSSKSQASPLSSFSYCSLPGHPQSAAIKVPHAQFQSNQPAVKRIPPNPTNALNKSPSKHHKILRKHSKGYRTPFDQASTTASLS